jgi:predicted acyl esterase
MTSGALRARHREEGKETLLVADQSFSGSVPLSPVMHRVQTGHRIRLLVEPAQCGELLNPHTGEPINAQTHWAPATIRLLHGAGRTSRLVLPTL